ncbi:hypothetical protein RRG08_012274 [Elysia crispata]|uniref:Uncharacterized protein n=1 Tax=Elysia crispata TaxID=231223 RepID=A0AAE1BB31_9GAST|nr:hypothetical protein RRG08_012274 [Elysia crispata]
MPAKWKHQMRSFQRIDRSPGRGGEIVGWNMAATREDAGKRHRGKRSALILKREGGKTGYTMNLISKTPVTVWQSVHPHTCCILVFQARSKRSAVAELRVFFSLPCPALFVCVSCEAPQTFQTKIGCALVGTNKVSPATGSVRTAAFLAASCEYCDRGDCGNGIVPDQGSHTIDHRNVLPILTRRTCVLVTGPLSLPNQARVCFIHARLVCSGIRPRQPESFLAINTTRAGGSMTWSELSCEHNNKNPNLSDTPRTACGSRGCTEPEIQFSTRDVLFGAENCATTRKIRYYSQLRKYGTRSGELLGKFASDAAKLGDLVPVPVLNSWFWCQTKRNRKRSLKEIDSKPGQRGKKKGRDRQAPMLSMENRLKQIGRYRLDQKRLGALVTMSEDLDLLLRYTANHGRQEKHS